MEFKSKSNYDLIFNKEMKINDIYGIEIDSFRLFKNQVLNLGEQITVISGRNGTMKSTLMGLVAQPYRSISKDVYGKLMQTKFNEVFKLSSEKDRDDYLYYIKLSINDNLPLKEPVPLYYQPGSENSKSSKKDRHRLVPSGRAKGDGFFNLPSVYVNLKRLYPLIDSGEIKTSKVNYSEDEKKFISSLYQRVLLKSDFDEFESYSAAATTLNKNPNGPANSYYDIESISSGEDNLSTFADVLISFMRVHQQNKDNGYTGLTGLLSIDEFEASLHPIAQMKLFDFIYRWSKKYNVKIILNTHSLFLIQNIYLTFERDMASKYIIINFIASQFERDDTLRIIENPPYNIGYSELTLSHLNSDSEFFKVKILCEDEVAKNLIKKIIKKKKINEVITYSHIVNSENVGTSYTHLVALCKNFPSILTETRAIVIFDADIDLTRMNIGNYNHAISLPSIYGFAFEKEIVNYILDLDGSDPFFRTYHKSKEMFKVEFSSYQINLNTNTYSSDDNVKPFKHWYDDHKTEANKYMTHYVRNNEDTFSEFRDNLIDYINTIRVKNGFTKIELR